MPPEQSAAEHRTKEIALMEPYDGTAARQASQVWVWNLSGTLTDIVKTSLRISISQDRKAMRKQRLAPESAVAEGQNGVAIATIDAPKVRQIHKEGEVTFRPTSLLR